MAAIIKTVSFYIQNGCNHKNSQFFIFKMAAIIRTVSFDIQNGCIDKNSQFLHSKWLQ
jgi:hypothetical protein